MQHLEFLTVVLVPISRLQLDIFRMCIDLAADLMRIISKWLSCNTWVNGFFNPPRHCKAQTSLETLKPSGNCLLRGHQWSSQKRPIPNNAIYFEDSKNYIWLSTDVCVWLVSYFFCVRHVLLRDSADPRSPVIKNTFVSCWRQKLLFGCTLKNRLSTKIQYTMH